MNAELVSAQSVGFLPPDGRGHEVETDGASESC